MVKKILQKIIVKGAREHNLNNINIDIPRNQLVVITGVSGSGKSSLAFDTIYAEGQRRYVESLSAYARQFLGRVDKPDVDYIGGLSPAISVDQKGVSRNPRSTVGTVTEIYDYLRLLYSRIGKPHCYICGELVSKQTVQQIVDSVMQIKKGSKTQILAPVVRHKKGEHKDIFSKMSSAGFVRARINGSVMEISESIKLEKQKWHDIEIIVDRIIINKSMDKTRVADSVETALKIGKGVVIVSEEGGSDLLFSENLSCTKCEVSLQELQPRSFSFNSPSGACELCAGLGIKTQVDPSLVLPDLNLSFREGAIKPWSGSGISWYFRQIKRLSSRYGFSVDVPVGEISENLVEIIMFGDRKQLQSDENVMQRRWRGRRRAGFEGVITNLQRRYKETSSGRVRTYIEKYMSSQKCEGCNGQRLKPEALSVKINSNNIIDITNKSILESLEWVEEIGSTKPKTKDSKKSLNSRDLVISDQIIKEIQGRLAFLNNIGLGYLSLGRQASTLSGGEAQRIRLATQIGSGLVGVLYVCDEPSIGLHSEDGIKLIKTLKNLRDLGNTVIVVEHDEEIIRAADHIVDIGPGAGMYGGEVVGQGSVSQLSKSKKSTTGQYLNGSLSISTPKSRRKGNGNSIIIKGAKENNLKNIDLKIPLGKLVCVTGVSGSGKSSLINQVLYQSVSNKLLGNKEDLTNSEGVFNLEYLDKVIKIDQSPIGRTPRSNPATYTGAFTPIRELFASVPEARIRGYKPGRFSFNVKGGRCEACSGDGHIKIEMQFLPDVNVPCEICDGARYGREATEILWKNKNIVDVLEMTVYEAADFFSNVPRIKTKLETMKDVGLGYVKLGQPATTLSGGEAQRIKLSSELAKSATGKTLYILDEPTTGLSFSDCANLLKVLHRLVDSGNTVVLIEHHLDMIRNGDWVIDLGPGAGEEGGEIVVQGTPEDIIKSEKSITGKHIKQG